jgi:hypothetical protein
MRLPLTINSRAFAETLADGPARFCGRLLQRRCVARQPNVPRSHRRILRALRLALHCESPIRPESFLIAGRQVIRP